MNILCVPRNPQLFISLSTASNRIIRQPELKTRPNKRSLLRIGRRNQNRLLEAPPVAPGKGGGDIIIFLKRAIGQDSHLLPTHNKRRLS
jgi:hypothetical protein